MKKKVLSLLLVASLLLGLFAVCGSAVAEKADEEEIVLTYWHWNLNGYKPIMEAFMELHPNVKFELVDVAAGDYVVKIQQSLAAGTELPDIIVVMNATPNTYDNYKILNNRKYTSDLAYV